MDDGESEMSRKRMQRKAAYLNKMLPGLAGGSFDIVSGEGRARLTENASFRSQVTPREAARAFGAAVVREAADAERAEEMRTARLGVNHEPLTDDQATAGEEAPLVPLEKLLWGDVNQTSVTDPDPQPE